jgi:RNA polymerase sigma factor (sigma-70 family)
MIEELDPIYRDILLLRYRHAMKNGEIAKLLNISESAVKVRYLRAKKLLLQKRGKELDEMRKT